jgi:two-component sensor histidine kinase
MIDQKVAKVLLASGSKEVFVPITGSNKPTIPDDVVMKWQHILDLAAKIIDVPAGLIMQLHENEIEVFLSSQTPRNPYHPHETAPLNSGLYCETVVGTRKELLVPNALADTDWDQNPDVELDMISYFGVPIQWSDGEVFGTFCVLDQKDNSYSDIYRDLIYSLRDIVEADLKTAQTTQYLQQQSINKELLLREIHHRVKNHFNLLLSSISLQTVYTSPEHTIDQVMVDIQSRISAIALINEKLYKSKDVSNLSLKSYLQDLGNQILKQFSNQPVRFDCDGDNLIASPEISVPCGLLVSEWMTNSIKHAFNNTPHPEIKITLKKQPSGEIRITYQDNGEGKFDGSDLDQADSLGMLLIQQLAIQLGATLTEDNHQGLKYSLTFDPTRFK